MSNKLTYVSLVWFDIRVQYYSWNIQKAKRSNLYFRIVFNSEPIVDW